eukprot:1868857-Prorocentrum_lima.AAC.1
MGEGRTRTWFKLHIGGHLSSEESSRVSVAMKASQERSGTRHKGARSGGSGERGKRGHQVCVCASVSVREARVRVR